MAERIRNYISKVFWFDYRSLALFRIAMGALVIYDLSIRVRYAEFFYSDLGILPRKYLSDNYISLHSILGSVEWIYFLFTITAIVAVMFMTGWKSRWTTVLLFILTLSMHNRNPDVNNAGDIMLRIVMFMSIFLPLDKRLVIGKSRSINFSSGVYSSIWVVLYIVQIILLYCVAGYIKNNGSWNLGRAMNYVVQMYSFTRPYASSLIQFPWLLTGLTFFTLFIERALWCIFFIPRRTALIRSILVVVFVGFHTGLLIFMEIGVFPFIGMMLWLPLIPSAVWDKGLYFFKKLNYWKAPNEVANFKKEKWYGYVLPILMVVVMVYDNLDRTPLIKANKYMQNFVNFTTFKQHWGVFPGPPKTDGYFVIKATLNNGEVLNLYNGERPYEEMRPKGMKDAFPTQRHRKLLLSMRKSKTKYRWYYLDYVIEKWNASHDGPRKIKTAALIYIKEKILREGGYEEIKRQQFAYRLVDR